MQVDLRAGEGKLLGWSDTGKEAGDAPLSLLDTAMRVEVPS